MNRMAESHRGTFYHEEVIQRTYRSINQTNKQNVHVDKYLRASSSSKSYIWSNKPHTKHVCVHIMYIHTQNIYIYIGTLSREMKLTFWFCYGNRLRLQGC